MAKSSDFPPWHEREMGRFHGQPGVTVIRCDRTGGDERIAIAQLDADGTPFRHVFLRPEAVPDLIKLLDHAIIKPRRCRRAKRQK